MLSTAVGLLLPFVVTPGASLALASERAAAKDARGLAAVIVGTSIGIAAIAASSGLVGTALTDSPWRRVITVAGGLMLVVLGTRSLLTMRPRRPRRKRVRTSAPVAASAVLANPKALTLYLAVVPAVMPGPLAAALVVVATTHIMLQTIWLAGTGWALGRLSNRSPRWSRAVSIMSASALLIVGVVLVVS